MARPTVVLATMDVAMAVALQGSLAKVCRELGLRFDLCPGGNLEPGTEIRVCESADALFEELEARHPMELADTLVILDVGARLCDSFAPVAQSTSQWHVTRRPRIGVAAELLLRFPQVFPVVLSVATPVGFSNSELYRYISSHLSGHLPAKDSTDWNQFRQVCDDLCRIQGPKGNGKAIAIPQAFYSGLSFASPANLLGLASSLTRFADGMRCWFDPLGLRTVVRNRFLGTVFGNQQDWSATATQRSVLLERLSNRVVAVDEERVFVAFNGYASYKHGHGAWMLTTYSQVVADPVWNAHLEDGRDVILRDIDLRFPDLPDDMAGGSVRKQLTTISSAPWKPLLGTRPWRIRVVSTDERVDELLVGDSCPVGEIADPLTGLPERYVGLRKPIGTLYRLNELFDRPLGSVASRLPGVDGHGQGGHGAPYSNLILAESLISTSRRCHGGPIEHLMGALLASEAYELLLGMSRTMALEALTEQHKHEVAAEAEFPGTAWPLTIDERRKDVDSTVKCLAGRSLDIDPNQWHIFLSQFWDELKVVYRRGEEFTAAEHANAESLVHGQWWAISRSILGAKRGRRPSFVLGIKRVLVRIATSVRWLIGAHLLWVLIMSGLYGVIAQFQGLYSLSCSVAALHDTTMLALGVASSSLSMQADGEVARLVTEASSPVYMTAALVLHLFVAYVLFGILISMVYRKVTRG